MESNCRGNLYRIECSLVQKDSYHCKCELDKSSSGSFTMSEYPCVGAVLQAWKRCE